MTRISEDHVTRPPDEQRYGGTLFFPNTFGGVIAAYAEVLELEKRSIACQRIGRIVLFEKPAAAHQ